MEEHRGRHYMNLLMLCIGRPVWNRSTNRKSMRMRSLRMPNDDVVQLTSVPLSIAMDKQNTFLNRSI